MSATTNTIFPEGIQSKLIDLGEFKNENSEFSEFIHNVVKQNNSDRKISSLGRDNANSNFGSLARNSTFLTN